MITCSSIFPLSYFLAMLQFLLCRIIITIIMIIIIIRIFIFIIIIITITISHHHYHHHALSSEHVPLRIVYSHPLSYHISNIIESETYIYYVYDSVMLLM